MAYQRQSFIAYMHDEKGNANPGAYCNGLDNIEKFLHVDIDAEFSADECATLYDELQKLRLAPEKIGKNEHTVRQYASQLRKYIEFRQWQKKAPPASPDPMTNKIRGVIRRYKQNFDMLNKEERYKWEAIGWYKQHWDIDAPDFADMARKAFSKTDTLLTSGMYYAYSVLTEYAQAEPETVRALFQALHNEDLPLAQRYEQFQAGFEGFFKLYDDEKVRRHYQDLRAVMVYLTFEYPEKYYLFKSRMFTSFAARVGYVDKGPKDKSPVWKIESYSRLCDIILEEVQADSELIQMHHERLDESCYSDPALHLLTMDIVYYGGVYLADDDFKEKTSTPAGNEYWPSLEEYDPGLTKEDWKKYLLEVEMPDHPSPMEMLKALMLLGGEASCKKLSMVYGGNPSRYVGCAVNLGKRAAKYFNLPACMDGDQERYFPIPFIGRRVVDGNTESYSYRIRPALYEALAEMELSAFNPYQERPDSSEEKTDVSLNTILYGPPGTGKTYHTVIYAVAIIENRELASVEKEEYAAVLERYNEYREQGFIEFTTFHQSYGYEEFIEGIRPILAGEEDQANAGNILYSILPGVFKKFCERSIKNTPQANCVFIIDEINRGNISKIFGELITLIEETKRVGMPEGMKVVMPYSRELFGVPSNVYIIGTMNTADRSIATIDTALRRRFTFREMMPRHDVLDGINVEDIAVSGMLARINQRITILYDREHTIGHAYFLPLRESPTIETLAEIFSNKIIPLLQEYFYEDYEKIRLVLGDGRKDNTDYQFIVARQNDYAKLFGDVDIGLDDNLVYEINHDAFDQIEAYRSI